MEQTEPVTDHVIRRRAASLKYRHANLEKINTYARERMRARRAADPEGEREKLRAWIKANPEKVKARSREWNRNNPEKVREMVLKKNHGLTVEAYNQLFEEQGFCCAVCKTAHPITKRPWHVDHCHATGKIRGILCHFCNCMLGYAKDNAATLANAIEYLRGAS
jgi:hypothetical protein